MQQSGAVDTVSSEALPVTVGSDSWCSPFEIHIHTQRLLSGSNDLDFHRGLGRRRQFLRHALSNPFDHGRVTQQRNAGAHILAEINVTLRDALEKGVENSTGILAREIWQQQHFLATGTARRRHSPTVSGGRTAERQLPQNSKHQNILSPGSTTFSCVSHSVLVRDPSSTLRWLLRVLPFRVRLVLFDTWKKCFQSVVTPTVSARCQSGFCVRGTHTSSVCNSCCLQRRRG